MPVIVVAKKRRDEMKEELVTRYLALKNLLAVPSIQGQDEVEVDSLSLKFALADFETILKQVKGLK